MIKVINRKELQDLIASSDVQIVDVLPQREYTESHIPGAVNIPLKQLNAETVSALQPDRPVAVY